MPAPKGFRAGEVYWEFTADRTPLLANAKKANVEVGKIAGRGGKQFVKEFKAKQNGKLIANQLADGFKIGATRFQKMLKATAASGAILAGIGATIGVIGKRALQSASDMKVLADASGLSAERFQELSYAADRFGINNEKLGDIFKDTRERIGEMLNAGSGPLQDWLDDVGYRAGLTAEDFRNLSGDQAMGLVIRTMEKLGANEAQLSAAMESLASDSTRLIPLFRDNGRELNKLAGEARDAGAVLSNEAAQGAFDANAELERLGTTLRTGVTNAIVEAAPQIEEITEDIIDLVPVLVDWASVAVDGFSKLTGSITNLGDEWRSLPFSKGGRGVLPTESPAIKTQRDDLQELLKLTDELKGKSRVSAFLLGGKSETQFRRKALLESKTFTKNEIGSAQQFDAINGGDSAYRQMIQDRLKELSRVSLEEQNKFFQASMIGEAGVNQNSSGDNESGSGSGGSGLTFKKTDLDTERANNARIRAAKRLYDETRSPLEAYRAELEMIAAVEKNSFLDAGGAETFSRARANALIEMAGEVENLDDAFKALGESVTKGYLAEQDAARVMSALKDERAERLDDQLQAQKDADEATQQALEAEIDKRSEAIDQLLFYAERQREIAGIAGNTDLIEALDREILKLRERNRLIEAGASDSEAMAGAEAYASEVDTAKLEGQHREAFKGGVQGALNDLEGPLNSMFDAPIGTLANALFDFIDAFKGIGSGGAGGAGGGGGFGGFFKSIKGILPSFDGGGDTGRGPRSGGIDGKGGYPAILHPNETVIDRTMLSGPWSLPSTPSLASQVMASGLGFGTSQPRIHLEVAGTEDFYLRQSQQITGTAVQVTDARAPAHAQTTLAKATRSQRKSSERRL